MEFEGILESSNVRADEKRVLGQSKEGGRKQEHPRGQSAEMQGHQKVETQLNKS